MKEYLHLHFIFRHKVKTESFSNFATDHIDNTSNPLRVTYENMYHWQYIAKVRARTFFIPQQVILFSLSLSLSLSRSLAHSLTYTHTHFLFLSIYIYFYLVTMFMMRRDYSLRVSSVCTVSVRLH